MPSFGPETYGDAFADVYDDWYGEVSDADSTASFVGARAGAGPILELGVGTGRLVGPLLATEVGRRHGVVGIDASGPMLERCRAAHPELPLLRADLGALPFGAALQDGTAQHFGAALCAFNTLFNLDEGGQRRLFERCGGTLRADGVLVIEALTGEGLGDGPASSVGVSRLEADALVLAATVVDADEQTIRGQHVDITEAGIRLRPWRVRWTTPSQLDDMAADAGLELAERFEDVTETRFGPDSGRHVSVYRRNR